LIDSAQLSIANHRAIKTRQFVGVLFVETFLSNVDVCVVTLVTVQTGCLLAVQVVHKALVSILSLGIAGSLREKAYETGRKEPGKRRVLVMVKRKVEEKGQPEKQEQERNE
jgi:hypothetical protein